MHLVAQEVGAQLQSSCHAVVKAHHDLEVVVDFLVDDVSDIGIYGFKLSAGEHPAELVQKMYAPVIEHSAAFTYEDVPVVHVAVKAVEHALDAIDIAQCAGIIDSLRCAEVGVETALMVNGELNAVGLDSCFHLIELLEAHSDGLLADDVFLRIRSLDDQFLVESVVCGDQDYIDFGIRHQLFVAGISLESFCYVLELLGIDVREADQFDSGEVQKHFLVLMTHESMSDDRNSDVFHVYPPSIFSLL